MKPKIIDRYIVTQFLQTVFFGLLAFIVIFVVIDLFEKMDNFIDHAVPTVQIFKYYLYFLPEIIRLILPVSILLSGLFTVGKMANQNELTAVKASGVSVYRFLSPFILLAFLISLFAIEFGGYIVPMANKKRVYIEQYYMKKGLVYADNNIFFQDSKTRIVTINFYDTEKSQANKVSIQDFDQDELYKMTSRIDSKKMIYDSTKACWKLFDGVKREFIKETVSVEKFDTLSLCGLNFTPIDVIKKQQKPVEMTLSELDEYSKEQLRTGNDPTRILIEYHSRYAFAFASFFVILFGLPLSVTKRKGGLAIQFGINLIISFTYLIFMKISQSFGKNGVLNPFITAWLANFIFLIAGVYNLFKVRK